MAICVSLLPKILLPQSAEIFIEDSPKEVFKGALLYYEPGLTYYVIGKNEGVEFEFEHNY